MQGLRNLVLCNLPKVLRIKYALMRLLLGEYIQFRVKIKNLVDTFMSLQLVLDSTSQRSREKLACREQLDWCLSPIEN